MAVGGQVLPCRPVFSNRRGHARIALFEWGEDLQRSVGPAGSANVWKRPSSGVKGATGHPIHGQKDFDFAWSRDGRLALARDKPKVTLLVSKR